MLRRNLFDPSGIDGDGTQDPGAPDNGILFPDHGAFQSDGGSAPAANDWSDVAIAVDVVDDTFHFGGATPDSTVALVQDAPGETQTSSLTYEELTALYPGIVWPPMSEWATSTPDAGDPPAETPPPDNAGVVTVQAPSPAGLDWQVTPDFDDDPGWYPGWIPPSNPSSAAADGVAPIASSQVDTGVETQAPSPAGLDWQVTPDFDDDPGWYPGWIPSYESAARTGDGAAAVTAGVDEPPALRDEGVTASLTLAELNEQYPGIVWPANWWLL